MISSANNAKGRERETVTHKANETHSIMAQHISKGGSGGCSVWGCWVTVGGGYFATDLPLTKRTISNNVRSVCGADAFFIQAK